MKERVARHFPALRRHAQHHLEAALGGRTGPHALDLIIEGGLGDLAFLDVHHQAVVVADEADVQAFLELVPLAADHDAVTIAQRLRARDNRFNHGVGKTPDPPQ